MKRIQHGLGLLIAMFALAGILTMSGCKKEETTSDKIEDAADDMKDKVDEAADEAKDAADDMMGD